MASDELRAPDSPTAKPDTTPSASAKPPEAESRRVNTAAVASVRAGSLTATQSAIGSAAIEGDATVDTSVVGIVSAKGNASLKQGGACAVVSEGELAVSQGGGAVMVARSIDVDQGGSCVMVSGETNASRSYVGLLLSRKASFSEDSRVLFDWKAALLLAVVLLGGMGLVLLVIVVVARMVLGKLHHLADRLPHLPQMHMPEVPAWASTAVRLLRRSA